MTITDWIQAISTLVLVAVTGFYAWRTHVISKATKEQADASVKMAKEMREQRYSAVRPVIDFQWRDLDGTINVGARTEVILGRMPSELQCKLCNIGVGPAIDLYSFTKAGLDNRHRYEFGTLKAGGQTDKVPLHISKEDSIGILEAYYRDIHGRTFKSRLELCLVEEQGLRTKLRVEEVREE